MLWIRDTHSKKDYSIGHGNGEGWHCHLSFAVWLYGSYSVIIGGIHEGKH